MSNNVKASVLTITSFLTHCDCPVPVDLIYTMENGFVPLKKLFNSAWIQNVPSKRWDAGASFLVTGVAWHKTHVRQLTIIIWDSVSPIGGIFKASALWADAFYKSKCPSVCPSVCLSVCLSVSVFTFDIPFKRLFAPTSRSRMSNLFRDSESLGKSNGKKWSEIWTFLFESNLKSPRKNFALQNKVETMLPDGLETSGRRAYC